MRLLKASTNGGFSPIWFSDNKIPPYAILSHRWDADDQEVTLQDLTSGTVITKQGYTKIQFCGKQAKDDGLEYFWVDSCCIDKSSSAELSKAINSMFRYYRNADRCYVYLSDVSTTSSNDWGSLEPKFRNSRWFTRGWTLQEFLAPRIVEFFSKEGHKLGDKVSLERVLHEVTGVATGALRGDSLSQYSTTEKLSWAEKRDTKEPEDKAYSLLGIFDVFLSPIYGEGEEHALDRLHEAIEQAVNRKEGKRKKGLTKAIQVLRPNDPSADIIVRTHLGGPSAVDIIRELTGAELKIHNGKQQVVLSNGILITPMPFIHLDGFEDKGVEHLFPPSHEVGFLGAFRTGNTYKKEKKKEPVPKSCISFLILANPEADIL
jgi:hypothetical protein